MLKLKIFFSKSDTRISLGFLVKKLGKQDKIKKIKKEGVQGDSPWQDGVLYHIFQSLI